MPLITALMTRGNILFRNDLPDSFSNKRKHHWAVVEERRLEIKAGFSNACWVPCYEDFNISVKSASRRRIKIYRISSNHVACIVHDLDAGCSAHFKKRMVFKAEGYGRPDVCQIESGYRHVSQS